MPKILIVDDYAVTQRMLGHILSRGGYEVFSAMNGLEALSILENTAVDLMILDIAMPGMDGLTLLRKLRENQAFDHVPILMLTASGQDEDRALAEDAGATGFLNKPIGSSELLAVIEKVLD